LHTYVAGAAGKVTSAHGVAYQGTTNKNASASTEKYGKA